MNQLYPPPLEPRTLSRQVWDVDSARRLPGVGRALAVYGGLISQMPLDDVVGIVPNPRRPRLLEQPDLDLDLATFIAVQVEDYLTHGNAAQLVTARDNTGWPAAVKWFPAHAWVKIIDPRNGRVTWYLNGREVPTGDVVHAQRGADPMAPHRGRGVIQQHLETFDRAALQEESERESLVGGGVPSAAVIAPQANLGQDAVDAAAESWMEKFGGPGRRPAILPHGTVVTPLAWSPHDQQATAARQLSLTDVANCFNLDPYWLGAPGSSHTYRSPGPLFLNLLRVSLNPVVRVFERVWSPSWVPRGHEVTFDRQAILADDFASTVTSLMKATGGKPLMTQDEARARIQLGPAPDELKAAPVPPQLAPDNDDQGDTTDEPAATGPAEDPEAAA